MSPILIYNKPQLFIPSGPTFEAQTQVIDFDGSTENMANTTEQAIGVANSWSWALWAKPSSITTSGLITVETSGSNVNFWRFLLSATNSRLDITIADTLGTSFKQWAWNSIFTADTWSHTVLTWNGTLFKLYLNGVDQGDADTKPLDSAVTQSDTDRQVIIAARFNLGNRFPGRMQSQAIWSSVLTLAEAAELYASGADAVDLASDSGDYVSSSTLQHWWQLGREASPDLGKDSGLGTLIDVETNATGITDADRVTDAPS